jgi:hypothetical protein
MGRDEGMKWIKVWKNGGEAGFNLKERKEGRRKEMIGWTRDGKIMEK